MTALLDAIARETHVGDSPPVVGTACDEPHARGFPSPCAACLFDLDGVLTGSAQVHAAAWRDTLDSFLAQRSEATGERFSVPFFDLHRDYDRLIHGRPGWTVSGRFWRAEGSSCPRGT